MRRAAPMRTDSNNPAYISSYTVLRPIPSTSAASFVVNNSFSKVSS
jgi:hypothetical protein